MISKYKENTYFRHIFWITVVYFAAHWFLLIATGRWWDDWVYADKNWEYLWEVFKQSSLPLHALINAGLWAFPDGFYRIITFVLFFVGAIFFYKILRKIDLFSEDACFWITLLYIVIPVNDARIMWICYGYSLGLFMYWLAFYLGTLWKEYTGIKRIVIRGLSVFFLLVSFDTESIMMLTFLILFYFYYMELKDDWKWKEIQGNIRKLMLAVVHHIDYLFAPIVWYVGTKLLFPGYGMYGGHSYIPWDELAGIIINSPRNAYETFKRICYTYINLLKDSRVVAIIAVVLIIYIILLIINRLKIRRHYAVLSENILKNCGMTILGAIVFFIGFFPYAVKRNAPISNIYTGGRDALLLGIGTAIVLYYFIQLLFRNKVNKAVIITLISAGVIHFNLTYLDWQEAYYQQLQLQQAIKKSDEIKQNNTFMVMYRGAQICTSFYQTNGNSWAATGEQTRFYMTGTRDLSELINMNDETWFLNAFGMNQYEYGDKTIDGIIFVDYTDIGGRTVFEKKFHELFYKDAFESWIEEMTNVKYTPITKEESDYILESYMNGKLDDSMIYEMYY